MKGYDSLIESVGDIARELQELQARAVIQYTPVVEAILATRSRDIQNIEQTLDGLLDFCGYEPALQLYRRLCRHYFAIDPVATANYIDAYRELWDAEETGDEV